MIHACAHGRSQIERRSDVASLKSQSAASVRTYRKYPSSPTGVRVAGSRSASGAKRHTIPMGWALQPSGCIEAWSRWAQPAAPPVASITNARSHARYMRSAPFLFIWYSHPGRDGGPEAEVSEDPLDQRPPLDQETVNRRPAVLE